MTDEELRADLARCERLMWNACRWLAACVAIGAANALAAFVLLASWHEIGGDLRLLVACVNLASLALVVWRLDYHTAIFRSMWTTRRAIRYLLRLPQ